jgi:hypothetical protein
MMEGRWVNPLSNQFCLSFALQTLYEELWQPAPAELFRAYHLFGIGAVVFNLHFPIAIVFDDGVLTTPAKGLIMQINNSANFQHYLFFPMVLL